MNISQSLIKSYTDYKNGNECGLIIHEKYVKKNYPPPTDAMRKGIYFEYKATGALPLDGKIPQPDIVYKGKSNESISAEYKRAEESVLLFKTILNYYKIKILNVGKKVTVSGMTGIVDIEAEWDSRKVYIDLKYSALIDDKWNEMGWETESLPYKDKLMLQGVHYKILAKESEGIEDIPFYYFIFSPADSKYAKIILQEVDEERKNLHYAVVSKVRDEFKRELESGGFKAYPSLKRCSGCYLFNTCQHRTEVPLIETVYY